MEWLRDSFDERPYVTALALAVATFWVEGFLRTRTTRDFKRSHPRFLPVLDLVRVLYYGGFVEFIIARRKQLKCDNFFFWLPGPSSILLLSQPEDQAAVMAKEGKLKLTVQLPDTVTLIHGPQNFQNIAGDEHKFLRKIFSSLLSPRALNSFVPVIVQEFTAMWNKLQDAGVIKIEKEIREAQFRIMCHVFFGLTAENETELRQLNEDFELEVEALFAPKFSAKFKNGLAAAKRSKKYLSSRFRAVLSERRNATTSKSSEDSVVGNALQTIADTIIADGIDNDPIVLSGIDDNLLLLLEASHATTMTITSSMMFFLNHPENQSILENLRGEVATIQDPTYAALKAEMPYADACIKESMRLAPIIGGVMYNLSAGSCVQVRGREITGPATMFFSFSHHYKDAAVFADPEEFKPERWLPGKDEASARAKMIFKPFGVGRHLCLGHQLATIVMKASLYCFAQNPKRGIAYDVENTKIVRQIFPDNQVSNGFVGKVVAE